MERALQISSTEPSDFIHNMTRELRAVLYLSLIPRQHVAIIKGVTYSFLTNEYTERSRKESWQSPWQMIPVTGNWDPATPTVGELFPLCQHTAHREEVILPFYDLLYLASVLALETVYFGDQLYIPRLPFSSALRSVKYSTVYYHFIWLQFFPLTVVQGSLDSESLPLSNSICLNVKKKKKSRTLYNPSNLAFLRKYLIGVAFLKLYLLDAGAGRGTLGVENTVTFRVRFFRKVIFCS